MESSSFSRSMSVYDFIEQPNEYFLSYEISIEDNGVGITEEGIDKLFQNFGKLAETKDINQVGTGLGLSVCKTIIETMGGSVTCTSTLGLGTKFIINFSTKYKCIESNPSFPSLGEELIFLNK